jgi:hypothetical protein
MQRKLLPVEEGIQWRVCGERKTHHGDSYQMQLKLCRTSELLFLDVQEGRDQDL